LILHKTSAITISIFEYLIIRSFSTLFSFPSEKIERQSPTGDDQSRDDFESATHIEASALGSGEASLDTQVWSFPKTFLTNCPRD
jgi:hypothetical protein